MGEDLRAWVLGGPIIALAIGLTVYRSQRSVEVREQIASVSVGTFEHDGFRVAVEFVPMNHQPADDPLEVLAGQDAVARLTVTESAGAQAPLSGAFPMAWLVREDPSDDLSPQKRCKHFLTNVFSGRGLRRPDVSLNQYHLVTLDENNSVSVIDPQIQSTKTKMLALVSLSSPGRDLVLGPDRTTVFVSLSAGGLLAAVDLRRMQASYMEVGGNPDRLFLQPDQRLLWVSDRSEPSVRVVDVATREVRETFDISEGAPQVAFREDSRYAYVGASGSKEVTVVDTHRLRAVADLDAGAEVTSIAISPHSRKVYVGSKSGSVAAFDDERFRRVGSLRIDAELGQVRITPDGRFGFALDAGRPLIHIFATATDRVIHTVPAASTPDHVEFSAGFAYVRQARSSDYVLIELTSLGEGRSPVVTTATLGRTSRQPASLHPRTFAELPEGGGALVLNAADRAIYHYAEGMTAPMGSYRLYPWAAQAMVLANRALREVRDGVYETTFRAPSPGVYRAVVLLPTTPQLYDCSLAVHVKDSRSANSRGGLRLDHPPDVRPLASGKPTRLEVRLVDAATGTPQDGIEDVMLLVFRGPRWQWRGPARARGDGRYETEVTFPEPGQYTVMARSPSRNVEFNQMPPLRVAVEDI